MTRYEQIKSMTKKQLGEFLLWFALLQVQTECLTDKSVEKFAKEIEKFLEKEIDFDEFDDREIII